MVYTITFSFFCSVPRQKYRGHDRLLEQLFEFVIDNQPISAQATPHIGFISDRATKTIEYVINQPFNSAHGCSM